ncbi:MAG: glutaminyl-tRNA synthase (glutamine-hydrolyzing) subunit A [Candidatus Zambryskibacteria bacterium RIFOXYC1_FULL_39_10]|uniref:Glutamyl-tRNA(Gln) amidotransferase subunit A n=1 Tax=Candidatus Zambryskibacteria bacterium RIFOXYC1_FULL_39_10 TaxID=1802779 RepID=A0A1G2V3Z0_9BACT|nr:MAG: glutaminyl-tRNA synthase (glutamine-hydrolyzing) subunit A [Candidatus Zambryskibacteria bacterium RIFOXYD1_FULL_39_35]OHB16347.1 MAG: glutaminyl-tRNA synthase (glutamine-hydrolyzing) subunit A [Candidatus Zambryskibacteria bacterium RIFOXYC1_FULL_39_10]
MSELSNLTIQKARTLLDSKELGAVELAKFYLENINDKNKELNVFLEVYDDVLKNAEEAQKVIDAGGAGELTGIPLAIKDNILIRGKKASSASKILENYRAIYTATAAQKLLDQNAIFLGRTNMDEFAMGGSTENSAFGVTKNPLDPTRVSGGSSGGSAASVAGNMALGALGSDTGGSVREPASFCGMVGLKPTYGSVSRYGLMAMGSSLDVIGPITKTVSDAEIIFNTIKGKDKMDSTSIDIENSKLKIENFKIGVPYHILDGDGIDADTKKNIEESVKKLKNLGYEIQDISLPNIDKALAVYYIVMPAEVSSNLARFDGIKYGLSVEGENLLEVYKKSRGEGFGSEARRRIILGTYILSAGYYDSYYGKAMQARKKISEEFKDAFGKVDAILTPTTPFPAWKIGEKKTPLENYLADVFTVAANIVGCPAISLPFGLSRTNNMPLGVQLMSSHSNENILFEIGKKFLNEN